MGDPALSLVELRQSGHCAESASQSQLPRAANPAVRLPCAVIVRQSDLELTSLVEVARGQPDHDAFVVQLQLNDIRLEETEPLQHNDR